MIYSGTINISEKLLESVCADDEGCEYRCLEEEHQPEWYSNLCIGVLYACWTPGCDNEEGTCCLGPMNISSWMSGGAKTNITITEQMLYSDRNITLYVLDTGLPSTYDDLEDTPDIETESIKNKDLLKPRFLK